jgi:hypothetical protein
VREWCPGAEVASTKSTKGCVRHGVVDGYPRESAKLVLTLAALSSSVSVFAAVEPVARMRERYHECSVPRSSLAAAVAAPAR